MISLDVHILCTNYTRPDWLSQCLGSVEAAVRQAPFEIGVHVLPGVVGHLGQARALGYARGTAKYVTHVDDDDFVDPDAFLILAEAMEAGAQVITTGEKRVMVALGKTFLVPDSRHHLAVYQRGVLEKSDYADFLYHPDQRLLASARTTHIPQCVYNHRVYDNSGSRVQRRTNPEAAKQEMLRVRAPKLFVAEAYTPTEIAEMLEQDL